MAELYTEDELWSFTVVKLKSFLRANKLKISGLKKELIQRLLLNKLDKNGRTSGSPASPKSPQPMEPFEIEKLPPEMILQICDEMDDKTLGRAVSASPIIKEICSPLLTKRLKKITGGKNIVLNFSSTNKAEAKYIRRLVGQCITKVRPMTDEEFAKSGVLPRKGYTDLILELTDGSIVYHDHNNPKISVLLS